jgi:hypothetical protein
MIQKSVTMEITSTIFLVFIRVGIKSGSMKIIEVEV